MILTINLHQLSLLKVIRLSCKSGLKGGAVGGISFGLAAGIFSIFFESTATWEPSIFFWPPCLGIIPGVICGILGGIINAVFFYYTFDQMSQKRVIIFGGVWGFVVGALLLIPFIGVFEFYATLPSGAVGGLIGSASTNWILWNYLISEVSS